MVCETDTDRIQRNAVYESSGTSQSNVGRNRLYVRMSEMCIRDRCGREGWEYVPWDDRRTWCCKSNNTSVSYTHLIIRKRYGLWYLGYSYFMEDRFCTHKSDQGCCKQNPFYGYRTYLPWNMSTPDTEANTSQYNRYPVSYTHLDVYKRQLLYCADQSRNRHAGSKSYNHSWDQQG